MKKLALFLVALPFLGGCNKKVRPQRLHSVTLGMTKLEVLQTLGEPAIVRGSMINNFDQTVETWEYEVSRGMSARQKEAATVLTLCTFGLGFPIFFMEGELYDTYWFFFVANKLVKWCRAGDWETAQHEIKEIRFR